MPGPGTTRNLIYPPSILPLPRPVLLMPQPMPLYFALLYTPLTDASVSRMPRTLSRITWPVPNLSPGFRMLRSRMSQPSTPTRSASTSITPSIANWAWLLPKPRIAPAFGLFVYTALDSTSTLGMRYTPVEWHAARSAHLALVVWYPPASATMRDRRSEERRVGKECRS